MLRIKPGVVVDRMFSDWNALSEGVVDLES